MVNNFQNALMNPLTLAGLGVIEGKDLSQALMDGTKASYAHQEQQAKMQQFKQQQQLQAQLPSLLNGVDAGNPREALSKLVGAGMPMNNALSLVKQLTARAAPVTLSAGSSLVDPSTGDIITQAPSAPLNAKELAQTEKFRMEAKKLNKELSGGITDPNKLFKNTQDLRKEYTKLSDTFIDQRDAFSRIKASAQDKTGASDVAIIFNYMKLLDPASVVREGEFETARKTGGIPDSVWSQFMKVKNGRFLSDDVKNNFINTADALYQKSLAQQDQNTKIFTRLATKAGLDPEDVAIDLGLAKKKEDTQQITPQQALEELKRRGKL